MAKKNTKRFDGLKSTLTGHGSTSLDKLTSYRATVISYQEEELSRWYSGCAMFKKICNLPINHMVRNGFKVKVESEDVTNEVEEFFKQKNIHQSIEDAMIWSRLFGGAGLVLVTTDFADQSNKQFNVNKYGELLKVLPVNSFNLSATGNIVRNILSDNYGLPSKYAIVGTSFTEVHASRIIRVDLNRAMKTIQESMNYWSPSIMCEFDDELRGYMASMRGANYLLSENGVKVVTLKALDEMLSKNTQNEDGTVSNVGDQQLKTRLQALERVVGQIRGMIIGEGDKIERLMTNFQGVPEMLKKSQDALCAATNIPHTVLFNESPSGLGASGNSEMTHWNEEVRQMQENFYRPILEKIIDLYFWQTAKKKTKFTLEFNPLTIPTDKEIAEIQEKRVNTAAKAVESSIVDVSEIRKGFSQDSLYKLPYEIDLGLDTSLNNAEPGNADTIGTA